MKNLFLSSLTAACVLFAGTVQAQEATQPVAPAQPEQTNAEFIYSLSCTADAELTIEQMTFLSENQQALSTRQGFQSFAADPKTTVQSIVTSFVNMKEQIVAQLKEQYAAEIKEASEKYATENKVSYEDAEAAVIAQQVEMIVMQQTQGASDVSMVVQVSIQSCGMLQAMEEQITKSGCKTAAGEAIDLTVAAQFCADLEPKIAAMDKPNEVITTIQADLQKKIEVLQAELKAKIEALQKEAQTAAGPSIEEINKAAQSIYDWAVDFAGQPVAPVQVPLATTP